MFNSSVILHLISEQCLEYEPRGADTAIKEKFVYESLCPPYYNVHPHILEHNFIGHSYFTDRK